MDAFLMAVVDEKTKRLNTIIITIQWTHHYLSLTATPKGKSKFPFHSSDSM